MKYIKQYGLKRSGTNYMRALFELNLDVRILANIGGSKHHKVTNKTNMKNVKTDMTYEDIVEIDEKLAKNLIPKVVIIKNPYHWLVSYARYTNKEITNDFINKNMLMYRDMNKHWIESCDYYLLYEELMECPEVILNDAMKAFGISWISDKLTIPSGVMKRGGDVPAEDNVTSMRFDAEYYYKKRYLEEFSNEQLSIIKEWTKQMPYLNED